MDMSISIDIINYPKKTDFGLYGVFGLKFWRVLLSMSQIRFFPVPILMG